MQLSRGPYILNVLCFSMILLVSAPIESTSAQDCNNNGVVDSMDIDISDPDENGMFSADCDGDGVPDECNDLLNLPIHQLTYIDATSYDRFGGAIVMGNEFAIVSATGKYVSGVGQQAGMAVEFVWSGSHWSESGTIRPSDSNAGDEFGGDLSLSGDTLLIGASGANDTCLEFPDCTAGAAYVFRRISGTWNQIAKLTVPGISEFARFGANIALDGDTAVIGAHQDDDLGLNSGSAFVFRELSSGWQQVAQLRAADGQAGDFFGESVALEGGTAVVGARWHDDGVDRSGAVYVFREMGNTWQEIAELRASDPGPRDGFGRSVALSGNTIVVGASEDNNSGGDSGSAYVFREENGAWREVAKLTGSHASAIDRFGFRVRLERDVAWIGAPYAGGGGAVYVFREIGGLWTQICRLAANDTENGDLFSIGHASFGNTALVGAWRMWDLGPESGAAYAFTVNVGCGNAITSPCLDATLDCNQNGEHDDCDMHGDMNGDGQTDVNDVAEFVTKIINGSECRIADLNQDGALDGFDIGLFVNRVLDWL